MNPSFHQQKKAYQESNAISQLQKSLSTLAKQTNQSAFNLILNFFKCLKVFQNGSLSKQELENSLDFNSYWKFQNNEIKSPVCSKIIEYKHQTKGYKCYDCMECDNALMCFECFKSGDHKSHYFVQFGTQQGSCDCGNSQMWNEKGFCNQHKNNQNIALNEEKAQQFVNKLKFPFFIYLWGNYQGGTLGITKFLQMYSVIFLTKIGEYIEGKQQVKLMASRLLTKQMNQFPPINNKKLSILQHIFMFPQELLESLKIRHILFQLFSVQTFRICIIQQFFQKTFRNQQFYLNHKLKKINYIYLICVKLIVNLIKNDLLKPLQLNPELPIQNFNQLMDSFWLYFQDFFFFSEMKSRKQYYKLHLQRASVVNICFFTRYSNIAEIDDKMGVAFCLMDQLFLKHYGLMIGELIHQQQIIEKCLKQLFRQIVNRKEDGCSLAYQRAFAMTAVAYCKGDISILNDGHNMKIFLNVIGANAINKQKFSRLIRLGLLCKIKNQHFIPKIVAYQKLYETSSYNNYRHPQKNIPILLDTLYHKILFIITKDDKLYKKVIMELQQQSSFGQISTDMIPNVLKFLNLAVSIDFDQLVIADYLNITDKNRLISFYEKLLASFPQLNSKQFKCQALDIIKDLNNFEQFVKKYVRIDKNKLINNNPAVNKYQPIISKNYFFNYSFKMVNQQTSDLSQIYYPYAENVYDDQVVYSTIKYCKNIIQKMEVNNQFFQIDNLLIELLKIYLVLRNQQINQFMIQLLINQELKAKVSINTIILLQLYFNIPKQTIVQSNKQLKIKEKLMHNKKQAQFQINKMQQVTLNYLKSQNQIQATSESQDCCIYCKQNKVNQPFKLFGYCNFTNLYQNKCFKNNESHLYFSTCNHKIHAYCYQILFNTQSLYLCPICKRQINFIIPQYPKKQPKYLKNQYDQSQSQSAFDFIYPTLLKYFYLKESFIQQFMKGFDNSWCSVVIMSLVKEIVFVGLQHFRYFKKEVFPIVYQLYQTLKIQQKKQLQKSFLILDKYFENNKQNTHFLFKPLKFTYHQIKKNLKQVPISEQENIQPFFKQNILKILSYLQKKANITQAQDLISMNLISRQQIWLILPQKLSELAKFRGQCNICNQLTHLIYVCLLCGAKICKKCIFKYLYGNSLINCNHLQGTILISSFSGNILYRYKCIRQATYIYQNYLGQSLRDIRNEKQKLLLHNFVLNKDKESKIFQILIQRNIHNQFPDK